MYGDSRVGKVVFLSTNSNSTFILCHVGRPTVSSESTVTIMICFRLVEADDVNKVVFCCTSVHSHAFEMDFAEDILWFFYRLDNT